MNFVIFPMFFISSALYPLWKLREAGAEVCVPAPLEFNPFTYVVESVRFFALRAAQPARRFVCRGGDAGR